MIKIFNSTDTIFTTNGNIVINPRKAIVHKKDNDAFYLDCETGIEYIDYLVDGNIIVANTPQGNQAFRISNSEKRGNKIILKANHVFYDTKNYLVEDAFISNKNCNNAMDDLNFSTDTKSPFNTISDISTINSHHFVRQSLYESIQTVLQLWGGHLVRDNFNIGIMATVGNDNGVTVQYQKNLKDISCQYNWDNVVTKLLPVGKDGLMLPEKYVLSSTQYGIPYTRTVSFSQNIDEKNYPDANSYKQALIEDLRQQASEYLLANDKPKANYTVKANLEKITDIGDVIHVKDYRLGLNLLTNVISFEYDCIQKKYTEIEFGTFKKSLSGFASTVVSSAKSAINEQNATLQIKLNSELEKSRDDIMRVLGNSYVIYDGDKILIVDKLPKEDATNVIRINNGGIAFSRNGINGTFNSAWTINGTLNMQNINVINLTADLIKGGTLKLGSESNASGIVEIYDGSNNLISKMDKDGIKVIGNDGSYVLMNNDVGFAGFDRNGNKIYWVSKDEFHMKKSIIEEEITLCNQLRFIPIQLKDSSGNVINEGIGLVSSHTGGDE